MAGGKWYVHLSIIVVGLGIAFYAMQNCGGPEDLNKRKGAPTAGGDAAPDLGLIGTGGGPLAAEFRLTRVSFARVDGGISATLQIACSSKSSSAAGSVNCGSESTGDLKMVLEPVVEPVDFNAIEQSANGAILGQDGLVAQLANAAKPMADYGPKATSDGFTLTGQISAIGPGDGVPQEILVGMFSPRGDAWAFTTTVHL